MTSMTRTALLGLAAIIAMSGSPMLETALWAQDSDPRYQLTRDVRRTVQQAQGAIAQGNFPGASALLSQASGAARTDGDHYLIATTQLDVANRTFNSAAQVAAIDTLIQSPIVSETQRADLYYHRGRLAFHAQDINTARTMLNAAVERGSTNPRTYVALAGLRAQLRDYTGALAMFDRAIEIQQTAAIAVPDHWYRRAIEIARLGGDVARVTQLAQALLAAYPTQRNWRDTINLYRTNNATDQEAQLDLWRLQSAAGALTGEGDYLRYAQVARAAGALPEVERLVQAGRANSMLDGRNAEISALDRGTTQAARTLRGAIGRRASAAAGQATGAAALAAGNDYLTLGQYDEAVPMFRTAIEKGGIDADLANLRLGMALALSGDTANAQTTLGAVTGQRGWIARFWRIYAATRPAPTPVAPAAAPTAG